MARPLCRVQSALRPRHHLRIEDRRQCGKHSIFHAAGGGMAMKPLLKLGSRGSPLAMTQSRLVAGLLARAWGEHAENFPIQSFVTSGDRIADRRLQEAGGKGLFTKELDEALLDRRIDA